MTLRVLYNCILVRLGLRKILPAEIVNRKEVRECGEGLATAQCDNIIYANEGDNFAREGVMKRLAAAAESVKKMHGLKLLIYVLMPSKRFYFKLPSGCWVVVSRTDSFFSNSSSNSDGIPQEFTPVVFSSNLCPSVIIIP